MEKKVHGLGVEQKEEERDLDSVLFVGAVTTEVQIQNEECYVTLPVKGHHKTQDRHRFSSQHHAFQRPKKHSWKQLIHRKMPAIIT